MRVRNLFAGLAIGALGVTGAFAAMPAGAQTAPTTTDPTASGNQPEPAAETTQCQFGQWPADVQGVPASFHSGSAAGLYLWHSDTGWKAAVTHPGHFPVVFKIRVESSGKIYGVERHDEGHDDVRVNATRTAAGLRSVDWGYIDGMAFRTACAQHIVVSGTIDGLPLRNDQVFIGANGHHPDSVPFAIERQH